MPPLVLIVWLQALEPHALWHFVFALLSWCGDGPLYFLLFPLLYWRKAPAVWPSALAGFTWFPSRDAFIDAYRRDPSFPSGHALCATAVGLYLYAYTASVGGRAGLASFVVLIPLARLYLGVHYPTDVLAGSGLGVLVFLLAPRLRVDALTTRLARW